MIGVGGGGGNAVNHMYREGIHDVTYVLCNTDRKALDDSPVPNHLQLGKDGLGSGNRPEKARLAENERIRNIIHQREEDEKNIQKNISKLQEKDIPLYEKMHIFVY